MKNIGLIDVDGHNFPNLALMKIASFEKSIGNNVEWCNSFNAYNKVYMAKVFDFTPDFNTSIKTYELIKGGTGYNIKLKLPKEIENICPDYSIYNNNKIAYGFLTRGCPRNCKFCIVGKKEGLKSHKVANLNSFYNGQKEIKLLDPNLLACNDHNKLLDQLIESKSYIDFTQGLDCRFLTNENIEKILSCKIKMIHFAWDKQEDEELIIKKLEMFNKYSNLNFRKKRVYVLTNFDTTFEYDLYRIDVLKKLEYDPYVMVFDRNNADIKYRKLQRWVNMKAVFRTVGNFNEYTKISTLKNKQIKSQISMFEVEL
jgi:hypothetical protein